MKLGVKISKTLKKRQVCLRVARPGERWLDLAEGFSATLKFQRVVAVGFPILPINTSKLALHIFNKVLELFLSFLIQLKSPQLDS